MAYVPVLDNIFISTPGLELSEAGPEELKSAESAWRCPGNCSGHGSCQDGQCLCLVQFSGGKCHEINIGYFIAFGTIFVLLGCVALVQLVLCIVYEYTKEEKRSWRKACQVTVQKLLYLLVICATAVRGAYFFTRWQVSEEIASSLWSAYFPVIITGFSLIICFWAEAFHISATASGERQFLSKSTIFFIAFNVLQYLLLVTQLVVAETLENQEDKVFVLRMFNGGFALLMIIVVVFFIIYGVEVYFKVHGAFRISDDDLDIWQLHMSRLGLVAQAVLQLVTALFLVSDVAPDVWKHRLPILSQNFYDIGFRIVEFGVALWFPCVLWNCGQPEDLWVLNPKRIFRSFDFHRRRKQLQVKEDGSTNIKERESVQAESPSTLYNTFDSDNSSVKWDCWICYDPDRKDAGPLIQPCLCKGDVAIVHHDCLKKWLLESARNNSRPECKVCGELYKLEAQYWFPKGLKPRYWLQTFLALLVLIGSPFVAYVVCHSVSSSNDYLKPLVICLTIIVELFSARMFLLHVRTSCQRAKVSTMKISGKKVKTSHQVPSLPGETGTAGSTTHANVTTVTEGGQSSKP